MPDFDGGHYFLTVLAPILPTSTVEPFLGRAVSHEHQLAEKLARLGTGQQTIKSAPVGDDAFRSPFSRNTINHLTRFVIIEDPAFNGRVSEDLIVGAVKGVLTKKSTDPLIPQPVDRLTTPFLLFAAELDAPGDGVEAGEAGLRAYTDALWATMQGDLRDVFSHCWGFEHVDTADRFHAYIKRCQIETTMPFNDYWANGLVAELQVLGLADVKVPFGPTIAAVLATGAAKLLWLGALLFTLWCAATWRIGPRIHTVAEIALWGPLIVIALLGLVVLAIYQLYRWVMVSGAKPFPRAPGSDLPTVLKSLFIQQNFTRFAIEAQGLSDAELQARFGGFLGAVQPSGPAPTQPPGEVRSQRMEWAR